MLELSRLVLIVVLFMNLEERTPHSSQYYFVAVKEYCFAHRAAWAYPSCRHIGLRPKAVLPTSHKHVKAIV